MPFDYNKYESITCDEIKDFLSINGKRKYADFLEKVFGIIRNVREGQGEMSGDIELIMFIYDKMCDIETFLIEKGRNDYARIVGTWRHVATKHIHLDF